MDSFPLFWKIRGQQILVVGGGEIAWHKANLLLKAGAVITLIAPDLHPSTLQLAEAGNIVWHQRCFEENDLENIDWKLVIAATDNGELNGQISTQSQRLRIPVNAVDQPELSTVIFPSIVERSPLTIAVGSDGNAPVLVRLLRARLESLIPAGYGHLAALVGKFRHRVKERFADVTLRRRFWDRHLQGTAAELVLKGDQEAAEKILLKELSTGKALSAGEVYLVGGGPGDPDLLTFKALRLMQQADVVLYDRLVSKPVLERCRREAERIYVGKDRNAYSIAQENINQTLVDLAREGKRVLRLKGGDPFIFGRGGEEIEHLVKHDIPFQVVPGITAANGCAAYSGIPLTHRDHAQSVQFITGHRKDGQLNLPWDTYLNENQTLVFYMGLNGLETICDNLIKAGREGSTPAAMIEKGTTERQRVVTGTLNDLPGKARNADLKAPTLIIVGSVVNLRRDLDWFSGTSD